MPARTTWTRRSRSSPATPAAASSRRHYEGRSAPPGVEHTDRLVDINELPLTAVDELADGTLRIGALARMSDVARTPMIKERFPAVSEALLLGASEQLRNMASMGGNLCHELVNAIKHKWLDEMCAEKREPMFFVGDQHRYPGQFLVLGTFWPERRSDENQLNFDLAA